ncbi:MAG: serine hydrolase [Planctomycetes bacterium]|nr:serine hydrolase [Planctomycetota bacterium]
MRRRVGLGLLASAALAAQDPVAERLAALTLEQKAGQLFVAWTLSRAEGDHHERLLAAVGEAGLGGVVLSLGTVADAAALVPRLQAAAAVPLLVAGDFEGGVWFRLAGATELGNQMLVGATGSAALAEAMGRVTAREAGALGCHWVFAPVLDVNSNPDNPIINTRSFGEDPDLVARLGSAFARGVQQEGLLACGKHFPGHGDVDADSHLSLPTVPGDAARLRAVELRPFAAAARAGLGAVMTGHLAVPGLGESPDVPATLSPRLLGGVLRGELGFQGLVVTDALDMGGVRGALPPGEVAVRALLAGADVLLMPPDPLAARAAVVEAVRSGRVPAARLDEAVARILAAKARAGLFAGGGRVAADWPARLRTPEAERVADAIAARGLTLAFARDGALPLARDAAPLLVTLLDHDEGQLGAFAEALGVGEGDRLRVSAGSGEEAIAAASARVAAAAHVVLALDVRVREYSGQLGLPPRLQPVLDALRHDQRVVAVSFGDPYVARRLPHADACLCAYVGTERLQRRAAAALRGEVAVTGRLPVGIPGAAEPGAGCTQLPGVEVPGAEPADHDLVPDLAERIRRRLERAVAERVFPGGVCLVARRGERVVEVAVGRESYADDAAAVTPALVYDLASLTKVVATLPAVLRLAARGTLSLDDPVGRWLPEFRAGGQAAVTVADLLRHRGGLPAFRPWFRTLQGRDAIVAAAAAEPVADGPFVRVYSDVGYVLLGAVVEAASGESLAAFAAREVFVPLGMQGACFVPVAAAPLAAAPTESDPARGGVVRGHVHDENAFAMGGVAGHAGLFARADDVLRLGIAMLAGGRGVLPRELVALATTGPEPLGFAPAAGGAFGHTGFTGTSLWCHPRHDLCVVLLTNRVHPRRGDGTGIAAVRADVHELVLAALR